MKKKIAIGSLLFFTYINANNTNVEQNYVCGIFPGGIASYKTINIDPNANITELCGDKNLYAKNFNLNKFQCSSNLTCNSGLGACNEEPPPKNRYTPELLKSSKITDIPDDLNFTKTDYKNAEINKDSYEVYFEPQVKYNNSDRKYMTLGDIKFNGSSYTIHFKPGDYYFNNLTISGSAVNIKIEGEGAIRIFINNNFKLQDLSVSYINADRFNINQGDAKNLFIYANNNFESINVNNSTIKAFIYTKGETNYDIRNNNFDFHGRLTSEGNINIAGNNIHFYKDSDASELGYGQCPLCYAVNNGSWINKFQFLYAGIEIDFPRIVGIINNSQDTLNKVVVSQLENNPAWIKMQSPERYEIINQDNEIYPTHIVHIDKITYTMPVTNITATVKITSSSENGIVYKLMPTFEFLNILNNDLNTTADLGDYENGGFENYLAFKTDNITGSINSANDEITYIANFIQNGKQYNNIKLDYCQNIPTKEKTINEGTFDAWDTDKNINNRYITTKIANEEFNLTIAGINQLSNQTEQKNIGDINFSLFANKTIKITNDKIFNTNQYDKKTYSFKIKKAYKDVRVGFKVCSTYNPITKKQTLYPYNICRNIDVKKCDEVSGVPVFRRCFSSDNFAIRPYSFKILNADNNYKRAGEDFNLTIIAVDENNNSLTNGNLNDIQGVENYGEPLKNLIFKPVRYIPSSNIIEQMNYDISGKYDNNVTKVANCPYIKDFELKNPDSVFINGKTTARLSYGETGILKIKVNEADGKEFAIVDKNDTPDEQRFIKPAVEILDANDINKTEVLAFIPYKITLIGDYETTTGENWVYMANIHNSSPKMSAFIEYNITALNKQGEITKNFTNTCYPDTKENNTNKINGLLLNTTKNMILKTALLSNKNHTPITIYELNANTGNNTSSHTSNEINSSLSNISSFIKSVYFKNGKTGGKIYFNVNKNYFKPELPIDITAKSLKVYDEKNYLINGGEQGINKTVNFRYGTILVKNITTYNNEANITVLYKYKKDIAWSINTLHTGSKFGDINLSKSFKPNGIIINKNGIYKGMQLLQIITNNNKRYTAKIHLSIPEWLWYHPMAKTYKDPVLDSETYNFDCLTHPCFSVSFYREKRSWGGIGVKSKKHKETNRTAITQSNGVIIYRPQLKKIFW